MRFDRGAINDLLLLYPQRPASRRVWSHGLVESYPGGLTVTCRSLSIVSVRWWTFLLTRSGQQPVSDCERAMFESRQ
ncbi:MAG: hypothetical protein ACYTGL_27455 [Planctomycetota bacterium]